VTGPGQGAGRRASAPSVPEPRAPPALAVPASRRVVRLVAGGVVLVLVLAACGLSTGSRRHRSRSVASSSARARQGSTTSRAPVEATGLGLPRSATYVVAEYTVTKVVLHSPCDVDSFDPDAIDGWTLDVREDGTLPQPLLGASAQAPGRYPVPATVSGAGSGRVVETWADGKQADVRVTGAQVSVDGLDRLRSVPLSLPALPPAPGAAA